jgi:hypothetical protein
MRNSQDGTRMILLHAARGAVSSTSYPQCAGEKAWRINGANKSVYQRWFGIILTPMTSTVVFNRKHERFAHRTPAPASSGARRAEFCFCEHALACFALLRLPACTSNPTILCRGECRKENGGPHTPFYAKQNEQFGARWACAAKPGEGGCAIPRKQPRRMLWGVRGSPQVRSPLRTQPGEGGTRIREN